MEGILSDVYTNVNSPACFSSVRNVYNEAKKRVPALTIKDVKNWLSEQHTYTFHKHARRHFIRNKVVVSAIDEQ